MSSTNKTTNLNLNSWIGSDKPKRIDFNYDNEIIDKVITEHKNDTVSHINDSERDKWNNYIYTGTYFGNGAESRVIQTDCPFDVRAGIIFAADKLPTFVNFDSHEKVNYTAIFTDMGDTSGVKLMEDLRSIKVTSSIQSVFKNEYVVLNQSGLTYVYILFR